MSPCAPDKYSFFFFFFPFIVSIECNWKKICRFMRCQCSTCWRGQWWNMWSSLQELRLDCLFVLLMLVRILSIESMRKHARKYKWFVFFPIHTCVLCAYDPFLLKLAAFTLFIGVTFPFFGDLLGFFGGFGFAPTSYFVSSDLNFLFAYQKLHLFIKWANLRWELLQLPCIIWLKIKKPRRFNIT